MTEREQLFFCFPPGFISKTTSCKRAEAGDNLRRDNFLSADKLGVRHSLPVTFKDHDWLLGVPQVIVMDTVVCKHRKHGP